MVGVAVLVVLSAGYAVGTAQRSQDQVIDDVVVSGTGLYRMQVPQGMTVVDDDDRPAGLGEGDVLLVSEDRLPDETPRVSAVIAVLIDPVETFPSDFDETALRERFPEVSATELLGLPVTRDLDGSDAVSYDVRDTTGPPLIRRTTVTERNGNLLSIAVAQLGESPDDELTAVSDQLIDGIRWTS